MSEKGKKIEVVDMGTGYIKDPNMDPSIKEKLKKKFPEIDTIDIGDTTKDVFEEKKDKKEQE